MAETTGLYARSDTDELLTLTTSQSYAIPSYVPTTFHKIMVRARNASETIENTIGVDHAATNAIEAMAETSSDSSTAATHFPILPGAYRGPITLKNGTAPLLRASGASGAVRLGTALASAAMPESTMAATSEDAHTLTAFKINALPLAQAPKWTSGEKGTFLFLPDTEGQDSVDIEQALEKQVYVASGEFNEAGVFLVDGVPLLTADPSRVALAGQAPAGDPNAASLNTDSDAPTSTDSSPGLEQRWLGLGKKTKSAAHATKAASSTAKPTAVKGGGLLGHLTGGAKSVLAGHLEHIGLPKAGHHNTAAPKVSTTAHSKTGHHTAVHTAVHSGSEYHASSGHAGTHASPDHGEVGQAHHGASSHSTNGTTHSSTDASETEGYAPPQATSEPGSNPAGGEETTKKPTFGPKEQDYATADKPYMTQVQHGQEVATAEKPDIAAMEDVSAPAGPVKNMDAGGTSGRLPKSFANNSGQ